MSQERARPAGFIETGRRLLPLFLALSACSGPTQPVTIPFTARFGDAALDCATPAGDVRLTDLRLFVHDVRLLGADGVAVPVRLAEGTPWQSGQLALIDLEDGSGACRNGSAAVNAAIVGTVPRGDYRGLRFAIGVPASLNHRDPLTAPSPLDVSAMHWYWLTGYQFLRAGIVNDDDGFWVHLGSTRCAGTASAPEGCANANRPRAELPDFVPGESTVVLDLRPLALAADLADGVASDCSSGPGEAACEAPFEALGLDFASGEVAGTPAFVGMTNSE